jgi:hypothetical protein
MSTFLSVPYVLNISKMCSLVMFRVSRPMNMRVVFTSSSFSSFSGFRTGLVDRDLRADADFDCCALAEALFLPFLSASRDFPPPLDDRELLDDELADDLERERELSELDL